MASTDRCHVTLRARPAWQFAGAGRPLHPLRFVRPLLAIVLASAALYGRAEAQDVGRYLETPVNPQSGLACPSPALYSPLRPDPAGVPTTVGLAMAFQDISRFNDVEQTMTADVYVLVRWRDPRLADPSRGDGSADCPVPGPELWKPLIEPDNLRSRQAFYEPRFLVDANGTITLARRLLVEVANSLDLHDFPFDRHQFRITLWPTISRTDEVVFRSLDGWLTLNRDRSVTGWDVGAPVASVLESDRLGRMGRYSRYDVVIGMTRDWGYFALKLGVPLLLIVLMAYSVYYIPPTGVAQQVAVGMTSMLTLIAYMLALGSSLPKISYLTRADRLFVGCAFLVFVGLLKAVLTTGWVHREAKETIRHVDQLGRWLYPIALLAVMAGSLIL